MPPDFGFERVPTRALALLRSQSLPRLTVVTAPPGYGKTVLLSTIYRWLRLGNERCLWLSLDERDRDVRSVLALLRQSMAGSTPTADDANAQTAHTFADPMEMLDPHHALRDIVDDLRRLNGRTVIFIDNLGVCVDPMIAAFIESLTSRRMPNVRLVVSSVGNLPFDIDRMKLEVGGLQLGTDELSFDKDQTRELFSLAGFARLDERTILDIHAHTEGWPAAVRLAQVLMSEQKQFQSSFSSPNTPPTFLHDFSGDHMDISRVLTERVLTLLDPARVRFLMEVALVREFNADLADFITGNPSAREWLDDFLQRNLLIFAVGGRFRWFRFHTLLREYLLQETRERISPERRTEVLKRASQWYVERKDYVEALGSALEAPDIKQAEILIGRIARYVAADCGQMSIFVAWTETLLDLGGQLPIHAQGWYVWALCHLMQYEKARSALEILDRRISEAPDFPSNTLDTADLRFLRIVLAATTGALDAAHVQAQAWLDNVEHHDPLHVGTVAGAAAMAALDRGDLAESERLLEYAEASIERSNSTFVRAWLAILRAVLELYRARPNIADRILSDMRIRVASEIGDNSPVIAIIDCVHARVLVDLGKISQARFTMARDMQISNHHGVALTAELGLGACVACGSERDVGDTGDTSLDEIARRYVPRVMAILSAQRTRRRLHCVREADSAEFAHDILQSGMHTSGREMRERGDWLLVGIELTIARGLLKEAQKAIDSAMQFATTQGRTSDRVSLLLASMDAYSRAGKRREATRALSRAIGLAHAGSLIYPFILYQRAVCKIINNTSIRDYGLIRSGEIDFLRRLHEFFSQCEKDTDDAVAPSSDFSIHSVDQVEPLTAREVQLLRLINEGFSNQNLADQLSISLTTVKWHLRNLYSKLDVRTRSAALAKSRAHGLLA